MNIMSDLQTQPLTETLVAQARAIRHDALPEDVRTLARQCILDTLGCALAGADEELTRLLLAELTEDGASLRHYSLLRC